MARTTHPKDSSEHRFHPAVSSWFEHRFGEATEPQKLGWPAIQTGEHVLIAAPTGSGKTLAAFLCAIDSLFQQGIETELFDLTQILYISPLKALANDIKTNLLEPLEEIREEARRMQLDLPEIRPLVRTGDTLSKDRQKMIRRPPHILVTTPESLFILLTSTSGRKMLQHVKTVIVDEIHALARDKRGSHLSLSLERSHTQRHHFCHHPGRTGGVRGLDLCHTKGHPGPDPHSNRSNGYSGPIDRCCGGQP